MTCKLRVAISLKTIRGYKLIKPKFIINKITYTDGQIKSVCQSLASLDFFLHFLCVIWDFTSKELKLV